MAATWIDLLDPTPDELRAKAPRELEETAIERLLAAPAHEDEPRPTLQGHGEYVFGVLLVGFAYLWKRGDLDWVRSTAAEQAGATAGVVSELVTDGFAFASYPLS